MLTHLSLFSGIGGIDLAATWAGFTTIALCERDAFCQTVLRRHWPGVPIYADIADLTDAVVAGLGPIDLLSGGFPCQPFSNAGKRLGQADDRYLWPEMRRVIAAARPGWVCAENVDDLVRLALDDVLVDLEALGYTGGAVVLPACAVGAPHIRERCFVVAHADCDGQSQPQGQLAHVGRRHADSGPPAGIAAEADSLEPARQPQRSAGDGTAVGVDADSHREHGAGRLAHLADGAGALLTDSTVGAGRWLASEPRPHRVGDGLPRGLVGPSFRALGNAVVPSQVYPILRLIADHLREEAGDDR